MAEQDFIDTDENPFFAEQLFGAAEASEPEPEPDQEAIPPGPAPEQVASWQQAHHILENLRTNPQAMRNFILAQAQQMGLRVVEPSQIPVEPPSDYVETVKQSLPTELQFLAPHLATATWRATEAKIAPLQRQQQEQSAQQRQTHYESMARELTSESPGWERYEDSMLEILGFLRDALAGTGQMSHPKYGSALKLLYRLASGDAQAAATAGRRMQQALRSSTRGSAGAGRSASPNVEELIAKAKSPQQKWDLAFQAAMREHGMA